MNHIVNFVKSHKLAVSGVAFVLSSVLNATSYQVFTDALADKLAGNLENDEMEIIESEAV